MEVGGDLEFLMDGVSVISDGRIQECIKPLYNLIHRQLVVLATTINKNIHSIKDIRGLCIL